MRCQTKFYSVLFRFRTSHDTSSSVRDDTVKFFEHNAKTTSDHIDMYMPASEASSLLSMTMQHCFQLDEPETLKIFYARLGHRKRHTKGPLIFSCASGA
jgi:hypothetical protein